MRNSVKILFILALLQACAQQSPRPPQTEDTQALELKTLAGAELALKNNDLEKTLAILSQDFPADTPAPVHARRHRLRALAYERQSDFINAVRERLRRNDYLSRGADMEANAIKVWNDLNRIEKDALQQLHELSPPALPSWIELAIINRTWLANPAELRRSLLLWQDKYPSHPANPTITGQILADSQQHNSKPRQIALLLPFRGGYGKASEAIRDGFISAWHHSEYKPVIKIYTANSLNIERVYLQAVDEGAELIVGPLEKQAIRKLSEAATLPVSTLALNQVQTVPGTTSGDSGNILPDLMQFGLSPEDEARQVAEKAYSDGHDKALVIIPNDNWGQRLDNAFRETWLALGGEILEKINYDPQVKDYSPPVKQLLNIDGSELRANRLRRKLNGRLESETRLRQDMDMIFMAASPVAARQIIPQFRFHKAEHIPIYATSHIFTGNVNQQADMDMNGALFIDMPWILFPRGGAASIQPVINANFQADASIYRRLYALGVDAFHLIPHLFRLAFEDNASFIGETGKLSMSEDGRINRKLLWGKIINGKPELLEGQSGQTRTFPESGKSGRNGDYRAVNREDLRTVFPFRAKSLQNSPQILSRPGQLYEYELALDGR